jgi:hypothetical protein
MIAVTSILPEKNALSVSVNQDIEIRIAADFKLDPRNITFKINDVDIVPNVFSIYNGESDYELVITLYTRRKIKYGNEYRYGQADTRYGMTDIHPSILEYASRYVVSFIAWGTNDSDVNEEVTDSFVFTTEDGIFYNASPVTYFYSDHTQSMANKLPEWSKARFDKYSNFQQLINPMGEILEKNQELINKVYQGGLIQTVDLKELPFLFKYELDKNFEFQNLFNQDGTTFYIQPEINGIQGITRFDLFTTEDNTLKSLYHTKIPTRINTDQTYIADNVIVPERTVDSLEYKVDKSLEREGSFVIYCKNVQTSINKTYNNQFSFLKCQIKGISIFDLEQTEDIVIYNEKYLFTKKMWKKIDSVQFFNVNKDNITFEILHFANPDKTSPDTKKMILPDGTSDLVVWSFETRDNISVLQKRKTLGISGVDVLKNAGTTEVISELGIYDIDGTTPLELTDIAVDYNSNNIYGVDNEYLYLFDKREPYPETLKRIPGDNSTADFLLGLESDGTFLDEDGQKEIQVTCIHSSPGKKIVKYRIKITKPDGSIWYLLKNASLISDANNASIYVKQDGFTLPNVTNRYYADMPGEYLFELETMYQGGTVSKDFGFLYIPKVSAIVKYKLERILNNSVPVSLIMDYDQKIKIYADDSMLHSVVFHKDGILIDYINKILYSAEEYTSIDVE